MGRIFFIAQRVVFFVATLLFAAGALSAQDALAPNLQPNLGIPEDWSTPHVIYTRNGSFEDQMAVRTDPRFQNSFLLHSTRLVGRSQSEGNAANTPVRVDWAVSLGATAGMAFGESPAKYSFNPSAAPSCNDFVVYTINAAPKVGTQANLVALTNLYTNSAGTGFCSGTGPTFMFSYALGSGGSTLSPILSLDGTKVAWIEGASNGHAILHVTSWLTGQGTNATTGSVGITACTAGGPCDVTLDYTNAPAGCSGSRSTTNGDSDIYLDYATGNAFLSADNGILFHIKGIFTGTPSVDFCVTVNSGVAANAMSGPVYDELLNEVFLTDSKTIYAYTVGATSFTFAASFVYGNGSPNDTGPGPVLDAFNNFIYAFSTHDKNGNTSVTQLPTTLASASFVTLGPSSTSDYLFYGTPDNNYFTFGPKNAASTIYSCGTDSTTKTAQDLFAVNFNASTGVANTTPVMAANTHANPGGKAGTCSPITEFFDGSTDRIFFGNGNPGATTGANVIQMWNVNSQLKSASDTPTASATGYLGGSTGLTVDNNASGTVAAESVYFSTLTASAATGTTTCGTKQYCAVKLTQSALQ